MLIKYKLNTNYMNEIEKLISTKNYDDALQECLRTNHNHLGLLLSHILESNTFINQFKSNIEGIQTEGKIITETEDTNKQDINPPLLDDIN